ncbi:armadillo-type protein [Phlyctochytrium arcticum]|nr:armadillo-type protein [Phlyctochytrium arcticum]
MSTEFLATLAKVRAQTTSGLANQRQPALILTAIEETIKEQGEELVPMAYFGALLTILESQRPVMATLAGEMEESGKEETRGTLAAVTYLLGIVFPEVPGAILKLKFDDIAQLLGATLEACHSDQPVTRAVLACLEYLLLAQDNSRWTNDMVCKKLFHALLVMSVDGRPKVRRRAHDAVKRILTRPPPPTTHHPATITTIDYALKSLEEFTSAAAGLGQGARGNQQLRKEMEAQVLHVMVFLKTILPVLAVQGGHDRTRSKLRALCEALLRLPVRTSGTGNTVLTMWIFSVLDALFGAEAEKQGAGIFPHLDMALLDSVLRALMDIQPYKNDANLIPSWLALMARGFEKLAVQVRATAVEGFADGMDAASAAAELQYARNDYPALLATVFSTTFVGIFTQESVKPVILRKAGQVFSHFIRGCLTESMITAAEQFAAENSGENDFAVPSLTAMLQTLNSSLTDVLYRTAWGDILAVAAAAFDRLGPSHPALVRNTLIHVIAFRDDRAYASSFPYKQQLDVALHAAVQGMGIEQIVQTVALNIEMDENPGQPRRPYLLATFVEAMKRPVPRIVNGIALLTAEPKSKKHTRFGPHTLSFLVSFFLPLAQRLLAKSGKDWTEKKSNPVQAKLYETLGAQIWALVPGLCATLPADVDTVFSTLGPALGKVLQSQPEELYENLPSTPDFRPVVCDALIALVDGYYAASKVEISEDDNVSSEERARLLNVRDRASQGLARLSGYATRFLSILCNNYTTISPSALDATSTASTARGTSKGQALQSLNERGNQQTSRTIVSLLKVADAKAVESYFWSLVKQLLQLQTATAEQTEQEEEEGAPESIPKQLAKLRGYAMLDLLLILMPFLPDAIIRSGDVEEGDEAPPAPLGSDSPLCVFYNVLTGQLRDPDATLQKRTYKALCHLFPILATTIPLDELTTHLLDPAVLSNVTSGAKNTRMQLLRMVAEAIPDGETETLMAFVPVALTEVMLCTKEASERARVAAYECLMSMGRRMAVMGNTQDMNGTATSDVFDMDALVRALDSVDSAKSTRAQANLQEYFTMVIAGLAGETSSLRSASIASLARLLFEFHPLLSPAFTAELVSTILFVMDSPNREIIKSCLGFIKVAIVTLPQDVLADQLEDMVTGILTHSRPHKSHFKAKVRHVFERLIRRFSVEAVEGFVPEDDQKLLVNIRKRRERIKKQKAAATAASKKGEEDDDAMDTSSAPVEDEKKGKKFEEVYGSDSELDSDEEEGGEQGVRGHLRDAIKQQRGGKPVKGQNGKQTTLREDTDQVADFLDANIVSRVSLAGSQKSRAGKKPKSSTPQFPTRDDGRFVITESSDEEQEKPEMTMDVDKDDHYTAALHSEVAFTRLPSGHIKFTQNPQQKRRRDVSPPPGGDQEPSATTHQWGRHANKTDTTGLSNKQMNSMLGKDFKAKRARGDVKKAGGPDPYAYIPLTSKVVGGKKRKAAKVAGQFRTMMKASKSGGGVEGANAGGGAKNKQRR